MWSKEQFAQQINQKGVEAWQWYLANPDGDTERRKMYFTAVAHPWRDEVVMTAHHVHPGADMEKLVNDHMLDWFGDDCGWDIPRDLTLVRCVEELDEPEVPTHGWCHGLHDGLDGKRREAGVPQQAKLQQVSIFFVPSEQAAGYETEMAPGY